MPNSARAFKETISSDHGGSKTISILKVVPLGMTFCTSVRTSFSIVSKRGHPMVVSVSDIFIFSSVSRVIL